MCNNFHYVVRRERVNQSALKEMKKIKLSISLLAFCCSFWFYGSEISKKTQNFVAQRDLLIRKFRFSDCHEWVFLCNIHLRSLYSHLNLFFGADFGDAISTCFQAAMCQLTSTVKREKGKEKFDLFFFISSFIFNANISINGAVNKNKKATLMTSLLARVERGEISRFWFILPFFLCLPNFHPLRLTHRRFAVLLSIGFSFIASIFLVNLERDTELSFFINVSHTRFAKMSYHQRVPVHLTFT